MEVLITGYLIPKVFEEFHGLGKCSGPTIAKGSSLARSVCATS
jgi:hypothetical protein